MTADINNELNIIKENVLKTVPAEAIYLFGSNANGTPHKDSYLDIFVVIPDDIQENPLTIGAEIRYYLYKKLNMTLDLLVGKSAVFNSRKQDPTL